MNATTRRPSTIVRKLARRPLALAGVSAITIAALAGTGLGIAAAATTPNGAGHVVIIDATQDPTDALNALKLYDAATDTNFTPSSAPVYAQTGWSPVYDAQGNLAQVVTGAPNQPVGEDITVSHEQSTSWSLGGSLELATGFNILDAVDAELSVKVTASHTWDTSDGDGQTISITAEPGKTVWLEENISQATITGDFTFDVNGTQYEVDNVTFTQPASPVTGTKAAAAYRVMEVPATQAGAPTNTGGRQTISSLPKLKAYIAQGH